MGDSSPRVTIVILNWNGKGLTLDCLRSLSGLDYPGCDIVVVDNASTDGSVEAIRKTFPEVHVVENEANLGFSEGNNRGIAYALERGSDYVLILNNDTLLRQGGFLSILVAYLEENPGVAAVSPLILYPDSSLVWSAGGRLRIRLGMCSHIGKNEPAGLFTAREPYEVDYLPGCCLLAGRKAIADVGLLDPDYFLYFEDLDWCFRARKNGYRCMVHPVDAIYHKKSGTTGTSGSDKLSPTQAFFYARNGILFARKNLEGVSRAVFIAAQFTLKTAYSLLHMQSPRSALDYAKGLAAGLLPGGKWDRIAR